jgi:hypothetical protein
VEFSSFVGKQKMTVSLSGGQGSFAWPGQGPAKASPFVAGDIFGESPFVGEPPAPAAPVAAAEPEPEPEPEPEQVAEEEDTGLPTQGFFALTIIRDTGLDNRLPDRATEEDAARFLQRYGIVPCSGYWEVEKPLKMEDYCSIVTGECVDDCGYFGPKELKELLLETYPDLFWLIIQPRQWVTPLAP